MIMIRTAGGGVLLAWVAGALAQQPAAAPKPTPREQAAQLANVLLEAHAGWGPELNTPGTTLTIRELSREGGTVSYGLRAEGLPKDKKFVLFQWPVTQPRPVPALRGVTFDEEGIAVCAGREGTCGAADKPNDPVELTTVPAQGEPYRFAIAAEDNPDLKAYAKVVPLPIENEDKGCRVRAVVLAPRGAIVGVEASGFPAEAALDVTTETGGDTQVSKQKSDKNGRYMASLLPVKPGLPSGTLNLTVAAGPCSPKISVGWSAMPAPK